MSPRLLLSAGLVDETGWRVELTPREETSERSPRDKGHKGGGSDKPKKTAHPKAKHPSEGAPLL